MKIDWFTVGAQALNFLVLIWLLKRFLYKPILEAIAAREKLISSELSDAKAEKADALKEHDEFNRKNEEFEKERSALLAKSTAEAKSEHDRLLDEARTQAAALSTKLKETRENDAIHLNQEVRRQIQNQVFSVARKTLMDLAGCSLEEHMVDAFIQRLKGLTAEEKAKMLPSVKAVTLPVSVRSTVTLPDILRGKIETEVKEVLGSPAKIQFETNPDLISGIELTMNGIKLAWSISDYLSALEKIVSEPKGNPGVHAA